MNRRGIELCGCEQSDDLIERTGRLRDGLIEMLADESIPTTYYESIIRRLLKETK